MLALAFLFGILMSTYFALDWSSVTLFWVSSLCLGSRNGKRIVSMICLGALWSVLYWGWFLVPYWPKMGESGWVYGNVHRMDSHGIEVTFHHGPPLYLKLKLSSSLMRESHISLGSRGWFYVKLEGMRMRTAQENMTSIAQHVMGIGQVMAYRPESPIFSLDVFRDQEAKKLVGHDRHLHLLPGLLFGIQSYIRSDEWRLFKQTGLSHIWAVSGLHMGLAYALGQFLGRCIWVGWTTLGLRRSSILFKAGLGLWTSFVYLLLTGLSIPALRAWSMLLMHALSRYWNQKLTTMKAMEISMMVMMLYDPFQVFRVGFILSYGMVFLIVWHLSSRGLSQNLEDDLGVKCLMSMKACRLFKAWSHQWTWMWGGAILSMATFKGWSIWAWPANIMVLPWVTFVIMPTLLVGWLGHFFSDQWVLCYHLAAWVLACITKGLSSWVHRMSGWRVSDIGGCGLCLALIGYGLMSLPTSLKCYRLGLMYLLPMVLPLSDKEVLGFRLTMLNVGQGLALLIETPQHRMMYDTGPRWASDRILSYLKRHGVYHLDQIMVSHGDQDHIGGLQQILENIQVDHIVSGEVRRLPEIQGSIPVDACHAGQSWRWDGIDFSVLAGGGAHRMHANASSCVLSIGPWAMLVGDSEAKDLHLLAARYGEKLHRIILLLSHHGSRHNDDALWAKTLHPQYALVSAGRHHRYHHPHPSVLQHYQHLGSQLFLSAKEGNVTLQCMDGVGCWREE